MSLRSFVLFCSVHWLVIFRQRRQLNVTSAVLREVSCHIDQRRSKLRQPSIPTNSLTMPLITIVLLRIITMHTPF